MIWHHDFDSDEYNRVIYEGWEVRTKLLPQPSLPLSPVDSLNKYQIYQRLPLNPSNKRGVGLLLRFSGTRKSWHTRDEILRLSCLQCWHSMTSKNLAVCKALTNVIFFTMNHFCFLSFFFSFLILLTFSKFSQIMVHSQIKANTKISLWSWLWKYTAWGDFLETKVFTDFLYKIQFPCLCDKM